MPPCSDDLWGDEASFEAPHEREGGFLSLDAHIMATPAVGDIDGDGADEILVSASYFFDADYYADPVRADPKVKNPYIVATRCGAGDPLRLQRVQCCGVAAV